MNLFSPWGLGTTALTAGGVAAGYAGSENAGYGAGNLVDAKSYISKQTQEIKELKEQIKEKDNKIGSLLMDGYKILNDAKNANMVTRSPANCNWGDGTKYKYWDKVHNLNFNGDIQQLKYREYGCLKFSKK